MSIDRRMDKQIVVNSYHGIMLSKIKNKQTKKTNTDTHTITRMTLENTLLS